jgi:hypothetical protein
MKLKCDGEISCQALDLVRMKLILLVAVQNLIDLFGLHKGSCSSQNQMESLGWAENIVSATQA